MSQATAILEALDLYAAAKVLTTTIQGQLRAGGSATAGQISSLTDLSNDLRALISGGELPFNMLYGVGHCADGVDLFISRLSSSETPPDPGESDDYSGSRIIIVGL